LTVDYSQEDPRSSAIVGLDTWY